MFHKTTVLVVGAVVLCFLPIAFMVLLFTLFKFDIYMRVFNSCFPCPWVNTILMLNSFANPLIYCWRQKEMRQFIFRLSPQAVAPEENWICLTLHRLLYIRITVVMLHFVTNEIELPITRANSFAFPLSFKKEKK